MTPQPPPHIQIELARRELSALKQQRTIAEQGIQALSSVAAELAQVDRASLGYVDSTPNDKATNALLAGVVALVSLRLFELQNSYGQLEPRITELEGALKQVDSGIVIPKVHVKN